MPKVKKLLLSKINSIITRHPTEFGKTLILQLFCNICNFVVKCDKQFLVDNHRRTAKHQKQLPSSSTSPPQSQSFIQLGPKDFTKSVTRAFLSADISLKKLQNKELKQIFKDIGKTLSSESTCRRKAAEMGEKEIDRVKNLIHVM